MVTNERKYERRHNSHICFLSYHGFVTWRMVEVNPITSQKVFGTIFSTPNVYYMCLLMMDEKWTQCIDFLKQLAPFSLLLRLSISKDLLTSFLFLSVWKQRAKEFRRLGAILRHCLISRADGEEQTEEFHRLGTECNCCYNALPDAALSNHLKAHSFFFFSQPHN